MRLWAMQGRLGRLAGISEDLPSLARCVQRQGRSWRKGAQLERVGRTAGIYATDTVA